MAIGFLAHHVEGEGLRERPLVQQGGQVLEPALQVGLGQIWRASAPRMTSSRPAPTSTPDDGAWSNVSGTTQSQNSPNAENQSKSTGMRDTGCWMRDQ